jgi:hypothetical protein
MPQTKCPICGRFMEPIRRHQKRETCSFRCGLVIAKGKMARVLGFKPSKYPEEYWQERHNSPAEGQKRTDDAIR